MAPRSDAIARTPGLVAGLMLALLLVGPLLAVLQRADGFGALGPADWSALRFTVLQAALSAALSCALAVPVARALARRRFPGRGLLVAALGAPFILPVIVAVLGLIALFGQAGLLNAVLASVGGPRIDIYGLQGILLAHVFFNLPLAVRILLHGWQDIPAERFRLAASLGLSDWARFKVLEAPLILRLLPGAFVVIFVICLTSFAVALTLGGGPRATTLELAIYQAMRFDFDLARAASLGIVQLGLGILAGALALWLAPASGFGAGRLDVLPRWDGQSPMARASDTVWLGLAAAFLLAPLALIIGKSLPGLALLGPDTWRAAGHSMTIAVVSTALCLVWSLALSTRRGALWSLGTIAISPLVLGTGLFLLLRPYVNPFDAALPVTAVVNALMALPFALRIVVPAAESARADYGRLAASLCLTPLAWLRWVLLPRLKRPLGFAAGLTAALAMGDLGVIALFADPDRATLPLQVYRLMGSYQMEAAGGAALLLLVLSLGLFVACDRWGQANAAP